MVEQSTEQEIAEKAVAHSAQENTAWYQSISADQCFWSVLSAEDIGSDQANAYRFEAYIPIPVEDVHISSVRLQDGTLLMCALEKTTIAHMIEADLERSAQRCVLAPASGPEFFHQQLSAEELQALNFLHGQFLAQPIKRWQRGFLLLCALFVAVVTCIVVVNGWQQQAAAKQYVQESSAAKFDVLRQAFPGVDDRYLFASFEQARRRLLRAADTTDSANGGSSVALAMQIMQVWPSDISVHIESVNFQKARIFIRGYAQEIDAAQRLWNALKNIQATDAEQQWHAQPLQAQQDPNRGTVFQIVLRSGGDA
ncbi:MAG: hypothetical protein HRU15_05635 [Planctomycetes bacterium]|nr:hypothetical protein [Planctomycetota bacterium]